MIHRVIQHRTIAALRAGIAASVPLRVAAAATGAAVRRGFTSTSVVRSNATNTTVKQAGVNGNVEDAATTSSSTTDDVLSRISTLRSESTTLMQSAQFGEARQRLLQALDLQQSIFEASTTPSNFLQIVRLLSEIVTCLRMSGVNPNDLSALDTVVGIYEEGVLKRFLENDIIQNQKDVLEHPTIYTLICFIAGCYIDGEAFSKAKTLLNKHLLHDLDTIQPSSVEGAYDLKDLRIASGLNFLGIAEFSDHSGCGGGGHGHGGHHHHHHDHSAAEGAWKKALEFTRPFNKMLQASKPIGALDQTDQLMLQATSIILDNLAQVSLNAGRMEEGIEFSKKDVSNLLSAYPSRDYRVIAAQAQLLRTLLESHRMDDAESVCVELLAGFPRPKLGPGEKEDVEVDLPEEATLETSRIFDELSNLVYQHQNLDYAEQFLIVSLMILRGRLVDSNGQRITIHPALARAENGLGLLQLQMKDYEHAEQHLRTSLEMQIKLIEMGYQPPSQQQQGHQQSPKVRDPTDTLAEYQHNLGLALMGNKKFDEAEMMLLAAKEKYLKRFTDPADGKVNPVHATFAGLYSQLAQLYRMKGNDRSALEASKEALKIKSQLFTPTSTQLIPDLYLTAHLHANSFQEFDDAIPLYKQLVSILERPQGSKPPEAASLGAALHWLANAYDKTKQPALAADAWRKAVTQLEKGMGPREVLPILSNLLRVVKEIGLTQEATEIEEKITTLTKQMKEKQEEMIKRQEAAAAASKSESGAEFEQ